MHPTVLLRFIYIVLSVGLLWVAGCASQAPFHEVEHDESVVWPENAQIQYRVFLLGNIGENISQPIVPTQRMLAHHLAESEVDHAIVFLGNSIPCCAPVIKESEDRLLLENYLASWLDIGLNNDSRFVVLPGHHENPEPIDARDSYWDLQAFLESYTGQEDIYLPGGGFPGPKSIKLSDGIRLLALNTQYWLNGYEVPSDSIDHDVSEPADVLHELEDQLFKYRNDRILLIGHHPVYSNGNYGGRFSLKQYLFPVPVASGLMATYRSLVGRPQDMSSGPYRLFRGEITRILSSEHNVIYAAAHERSLQYFLKDNRRRIQHHIVSGSAVKGAFVSKGRGVNFASQEEGFVVLDMLEDGSVWLSAWGADEALDEGRLLFKQRLYSGERTVNPDDEPAVVDTVESTIEDSVVQAINADYDGVNGVGKFLFGRQYRSLWATPVSVPALDTDTTAGGLQPLKLGGQSQSVTMRFKGGDGDFYMLRSIDKVATRSLSPAMRQTFARTIVQDQVAMMHPYGAFIIPDLADAAGIYHTNPTLVYIPPGSSIGRASPFLAGHIVLFEERPDEDMSDKKHFGYSENIIGSAKLMNELEGDNDHFVDAASFARARLFDMLIADHDRTLDNFRWASFEPYELDPTLEGDARTQGKIYRPVPRDRDKAFAKVDGVLPGLYRGLAEPAWQPFTKGYGYIRGLNRKGLPLDRRFTAPLQQEDWVGIAEDLQRALADSVIEASVYQWPEPVREKAGREMVETLKARRDKLPQVASQYYAVLASVIDVVGSNKHERFEVYRLDDERTEVVVYKITKEGDRRQEIFRRMVFHAETKEIRLYGFAGNDQFHITGEANEGIRIIAVGGGGDDRLRITRSLQRASVKPTSMTFQMEPL